MKFNYLTFFLFAGLAQLWSCGVQDSKLLKIANAMGTPKDSLESWCDISEKNEKDLLKINNSFTPGITPWLFFSSGLFGGSYLLYTGNLEVWSALLSINGILYPFSINEEKQLEQLQRLEYYTTHFYLIDKFKLNAYEKSVIERETGYLAKDIQERNFHGLYSLQRVKGHISDQIWQRSKKWAFFSIALLGYYLAYSIEIPRIGKLKAALKRGIIFNEGLSVSGSKIIS